MAVTNTLAYYDKATIAAVKSLLSRHLSLLVFKEAVVFVSVQTLSS
jgi:hypothetical protein